LALVFGCALLGVACRSTEPAPSDAASGELASAPTPVTPIETQPQPRPPDPERADKLRDLDDMCKAVDHDYADGTLRDYYSGLKLRTTWGTALRQAGDVSTMPGRTLERAAAELAVGGEELAPEHCRKLFDYLDEVE
jgi:hypothetical protein